MTNKWIQFYQKHSKLLISLCIILAIVAFSAVIVLRKINEPKVKEDSFTFEVNSELTQSASFYMENVKDELAGLNFKTVDTKKLGTYEGYIIYDGLLYEIQFVIQDTTAPQLTFEHDRFVFALSASLEEVNAELNQYLNITDNYELAYAPVDILSSIPSEEKELIVHMTMSDKSGNVSQESTITIQFSEDGSEKEGLAKEELTVNLTSTAQADTSTPEDQLPSNQEPETPPEEEETPTPDSEVNEEQPTEYTYPTYNNNQNETGGGNSPTNTDDQTDQETTPPSSGEGTEGEGAEGNDSESSDDGQHEGNGTENEIDKPNEDGSLFG